MNAAGTVGERIAELRDRLTPAERRIAHVVASNPQLVGFGTVADLAGAAASGSATVVRLAGKLGYDGFTGLQAAVQSDLGRKLRPAAERIREPAADDVVGLTLAVELDNVHETLEGVQADAFELAVAALTDSQRRVGVLSGNESRGVALQFSDELGALRDSVTLIDGNHVAVQRSLAFFEPGDVLLAVDLRRYDNWAVEAVASARSAGIDVIALSDSPLSPIAHGSLVSFTLVAAGAGPFDSHVGTLALLNALVNACSVRLKSSAIARLDRLESVWRTANALRELG